MRTLFKLYLLGQLIALPFMVGAVGNVLNSSTDSSSNQVQTQIAPAISALNDRTLGAASGSIGDPFSHDQALCDALQEGAANAVLDELQQLRYVTSQLYGEETASTCFDNFAP